jgi:hypothetical protein
VSRRNGCSARGLGRSKAVVCWNLADPNTRDSGLVVATESVSLQRTSGTGGPIPLLRLASPRWRLAATEREDRGSIGIAVPVIWVGLLSWRRFTRRSGYTGMVALERSTGHLAAPSKRSSLKHSESLRTGATSRWNRKSSDANMKQAKAAESQNHPVPLLQPPGYKGGYLLHTAKASAKPMSLHQWHW